MKEKKPELKEILAVPHFHYDVEWWKTEDGYNRDVEQILLKALDMLDEHPDFTYVIDQALALKPFWDEHPEHRDRVRRLVADGRIELVGGTWCAPDENIPMGEAFVRQFVYGLRFFEGEVGGKVTTAWEIDEFGHPAQIPQILARCGFRHFVFARGVQNWDGDHPADFHWEAPDGTRVLTHWFSGHYSGMMPLGPPAANLRQYRREMRTRMAHEAARSPAHVLMLPFGTDFTVPSEDWLKFVEEWNAKEEPRVRFAHPRDFFRELEMIEGDLPVVRGEFNPLLTGCYESREKVKACCRGLESAILRAERWAVAAWLVAGREYPKEALDIAWQLLLENDFHDIVCGTGTDKVYRNTMKRYEWAEGLIGRAESGAVETIAENVDTSGDGVPLVVFNALNFDRRDVARVPLAAVRERLPGGAEDSLVVRDAEGGEAPCQVEGKDLLFVARVPSVGYATYFVSSGGGAGAASPAEFDGLSVETESYRLEMDGKRGGIAGIFDREAGREVLDTSNWAGNEILMEEDAGNLWTVQKTGRTWRARGAEVKVRPLAGGAVRCGFEVRGRVDKLTRIQRVFLYHDLSRIDFETFINFQGKDRRVKVMFEPAGEGEVVFETPFYAQPRGDGHWCAQNWVDVGGGDGGAALLNTGTGGHDVEGPALGMALFRSVSVLSPAFLRFVAANLPGIVRKVSKAARMASKGLNTFEWELYDYHGIMLREWSSEGGPERAGGWTIPDHVVPYLRFYRKSAAWERGGHRFAYSLLPHRGGWAEAGVTEAGLEVNNPLLVVPSGGHEGRLPPASSFLSAEGEGVILSALKMAEDGDGAVARVYESRGNAAPLRLRASRKIESAERINFVENESEGAAPLREGEVHDTLHPWEIAAYRIQFEKQ